SLQQSRVIQRSSLYSSLMWKQQQPQKLGFLKLTPCSKALCNPAGACLHPAFLDWLLSNAHNQKEKIRLCKTMWHLSPSLFIKLYTLNDKKKYFKSRDSNIIFFK